MKRYILLILLLTSSVQADEVEVLLQAAHYDITYNKWDTTYNNNTLGIGYTSGHLVIGVYRNSFDKTTIYMARRTILNQYIGYELGVATGYEDMYGLPLQPIVNAYVQHGPIKLRIVPGAIIAMGLSLTWEIK